MVSLLGAGMVAAAAVLPLKREGDLFSGEPLRAAALFLPLAAVFLLAGVNALLRSNRSPRSALLGLAACLALVPAWFLYGGDRIPIRSVKTVGKAVRPLLRKGDILAEYRALASGLPFYSGRQPIIAWVPRETTFEEEEVKSRVMDAFTFLDIWNSPDRVFVVTRARHLADLPGARKLSEGGSYVLAVNR